MCIRDSGITYRLSEIRTEVIEENPAETVGDTITITTAPFLEEKTESYQPEGAIEREGISYQLKDSILEKADIPAHEVPITEEVVYEAVDVKNLWYPDFVPFTMNQFSYYDKHCTCLLYTSKNDLLWAGTHGPGAV